MMQIISNWVFTETAPQKAEDSGVSEPATLLKLAGADLTPARVSDASLVFIDYQNEYLSGPLTLTGAADSLSEATQLLQAARAASAPIFHVAHKGRPCGLFDRDENRGQIIPQVTPWEGEPIIEKGLPNSFAGTALHSFLTTAGRKNIIIAGFMTHMCVSSTARVALDLGYRVTIAAGACATRDLPDGDGGRIGADVIHKVALAELSDRFAIIAQSLNDIL
jgi:nicotinamidase-related amidase